MKNMTNTNCIHRTLCASFLIAVIALSSQPVLSQDLVPVSSITGGSSVFVFRSEARIVRRVASVIKPTRSKAQRLESVKKIKKQYETLAKAGPRANRAKIVDPAKVPKNAEKTLAPADASRLFAGVGEYYIDKGDYDRAIELFTDAVKLDDKNITAKTGMSEALAIKGNDMLVKDQAAGAKGVFLEALQYDPKNSAAYFGLGEVYAELNQYADAIASYEKSLENDKDLTEIYVPLGILYYQSGDIAKADQLLTRALTFSAGSAETQLFLGLVRYAQGRDEEALAAFQRSKTLDPQLAEAFFNAGESLVRLKRPAEAIPEYQAALALKPAYFDASLGIGEAFYAARKFADAVIAFQTASRLKNDNWQALSGWGDALLKTGKFGDAAVKFNLAGTILTRTKDFDKLAAADLYGKVGYAWGEQCEEDTKNFKPCQWSAAIRALEKAVELNGDPVDYTNLGWAYFNAARVDGMDKKVADQQAKLQLAKAALTKVVSTNKVINDSARQNLGAVLNDLSDFKGAVEALKDVAADHPDWTFSSYALGTAYFKLNDFDKAANIYQGILDKGSGLYYLPALKSLGQTQIRRKKGKEVKKILEELKKLSMIDALVLERDMKAAKL